MDQVRPPAWVDPAIACSILQGIWVALSATAVASLVVPQLHALSLHGRFSSPSRPLMVWKGYFGIFYALGWIWNGLVLCWVWDPLSTAALVAECAPALVDVVLSTASVNGPTLLCLIVLQCHLFRRTMESWAITEFGSSTMHASACLLGVGHYMLVSLSIVLDPSATSPIELTPFTIVCGVAGLGLFVVASVHQMRCNLVLAQLKRAGGYSLPSGDWFELTWSPLYLAEILIYASLALLTAGRHLSLVYIALWVAVNQGISAERAAAWYKVTFPAAASMRRATLFPGLW
ncbi:hypothetical protein ACHHYP_16752 [Achlya hypogyna]|uniref:3-oxo-5-alpha-steroid 4-dehydrogenase C-terminal domain-containing protein n=1 Tax=Achlya hypogyna TaxID=1202772 RepID=A0A1V9Y614_ACHHY|nr:hypothetical protein ACHHYP_16752 [Achlya hypogyna]